MNAIPMLERCGLHQQGPDGPPSAYVQADTLWRAQETLTDPAPPFNPEDY